MFLRSFQFSRITAEGLSTTSQWVLGTNFISKRYAGHSQYANRKAAKEASSERRGQLIRKYQWEIQKEINTSKNANPETNNKLKSLVGEAMKNNVPKATLENAIKMAAASLSTDCINSFVFNHPLGIWAIIEVSSLRREHAKTQTVSIVKKFGFQMVNNEELIPQAVGIITSKPLGNDKNFLDKALEDAITADCEEVKEADNNLIEFQCNQTRLNSCTKKLEDLGYKIENCESKYVFSELIKVEDDLIFEKLDKMEEKLQTLPGFFRISYNIE